MYGLETIIALNNRPQPQPRKATAEETAALRRNVGLEPNPAYDGPVGVFEDYGGAE